LCAGAKALDLWSRNAGLKPALLPAAFAAIIVQQSILIHF
jgi:hypothetical protein